MKKPIVQIVRTSHTARIPCYAHDGDGACDLCADFPEEKIILGPYSTTLIDTGIKIALPKGYCAFVLPRSGLSLRTPLRIANAPGLIDNKYRGNIGLIVDNIGAGSAEIKKGDRLAQLMIIKTEQASFQETESLDETVRGENGFGSTGI